MEKSAQIYTTIKYQKKINKCYQKNRGKFQKKACKRYQNLSGKEKEKM